MVVTWVGVGVVAVCFLRRYLRQRLRPSSWAGLRVCDVPAAWCVLAVTKASPACCNVTADTVSVQSARALLLWASQKS